MSSLAIAMIGSLTVLGYAREGIAAATVFGNAIAPPLVGENVWTARTSVQLRYFSDLGAHTQLPSTFSEQRIHPVLPSPDGHRFAVLTRSADLESDQNISELRIYATAAVMDALEAQRSSTPKPKLVFTRRSASNAPPIIHPRWSDDGKFLLLMMVDDPNEKATSWDNERERTNAGLVSMARLNVETGEIARLVAPGAIADVRTTKDLIAWRGTWVLYRLKPLVGVQEVEMPDRYPFSVVDSRNVIGLGGKKLRNVRGDEEIRLAQNGTATQIASLRNSNYLAGAISPTEDNAIVVAADDQPPSWAKCPDKDNSPVMVRCHRFLSFDLRSHQLRPLYDAPAGTHLTESSRVRPKVLWVPAGDRAILVNTLLPPEARLPVPSAAYVAEFNLKTRRLAPIVPIGDYKGLYILAASWEIPGEAIRLEMRRRNDVASPAYLVRRGNEWVKLANMPAMPSKRISWTMRPTSDKEGVSASLRASNGLTLELHEDPNHPQELIATKDKHSVTVLGPDPSLEKVAIAQSQVVSWVTDDGSRESGLLTMPVVKSDTPPALVVQNYYFMPDLFRPDGPSPSVYAAQLLAARGMAVLGIDLSADIIGRGAGGTEGQRGVLTIDAAVEALSKEGRVDPKRIGMIGFSRGGYVPFYAMTHPGRVRLSAAISADSALFTFGQYVMGAAAAYPHYSQTPGKESMEWVITRNENDGGFWRNRDLWLRENTALNIDKVRTPYMFVGSGLNIGYFGQFSELMGLFASVRRPLELVNFPYGSHVVIRPREREALMTLTADWMDFWLNGHEDAASGKTEQYQRWNGLRREWDSQQAWEAAGNPIGSVPSTSKALIH